MPDAVSESMADTHADISAHAGLASAYSSLHRPTNKRSNQAAHAPADSLSHELPNQNAHPFAHAVPNEFPHTVADDWADVITNAYSTHAITNDWAHSRTHSSANNGANS
jgi:hypothetical protein